jgi:hypothetical protein
VRAAPPPGVALDNARLLQGFSSDRLIQEMNQPVLRVEVCVSALEYDLDEARIPVTVS